MSKFNTTLKPAVPDTVNLENAPAYDTTAEWKLTSLLLTSFIKSQFYRSEEDQLKDLIKAVKEVKDKKFAAQAAIYARRVFGMRSITHVLAAELAQYASGQDWSKNFYNEVVFRPDDMTEILSYFWANLAKKGVVTRPMKLGFANAFNKFDEYQIGKYRNEGKEVSLVDVVNLVHPKPNNEKTKSALQKLVKDELRNTKTWESKLSNAGQTATDNDDLTSKKADVWKSMLENNELGYLALLRNLRNIHDQAPSCIDLACEKLTDAKWITHPKNLVFPFQYLIAYKQFMNLGTSSSRKIVKALSDALEISCSNVPKFDGETLVVVDNSGSMTSPVAGSAHVQCSELGAIFGMVLAKSNNADIMEFGTNARYIQYNPNDSVMTFAANFSKNNQVGHGTDMGSSLRIANKKYDRIIVLSDQQCLIGGANNELKNYKNKFGADPFVYSFDLHGYGSLQFPQDKTLLLAGFSEKIFDVMKTVESDKDALMNEIKKIVI